MRGKIRVYLAAFAVFQAAGAFGVYWAALQISSNEWIPIVSVGVTLIVMMAAFGWWLSAKVLMPLEKLTLLAKSIERNPGMSVPNTTGSVETDDLLHTVSRASRQLANFVEMMDEVAAGNTRAALDPLQHSDRLSESFQRFVAKVTDSVDAKKQLDELQQAIVQISGELSGIQRGEMVRVMNDYRGTRTITDAIRYLIERQALMTGAIVSNAGSLKTLITEGRNRVETALEKGGKSKRSLDNLRTGLDEVLSFGETASKEASAAALVAKEIVTELTAKFAETDQGARSADSVRRQFEAAIHKLRTVGEQTLSINHVARSIQDLSNRTSLVAVNASISTAGERPDSRDALTNEMKLLAERAEKANRAIAGISDSVVRDVNETNASIQWISTEVGKLITRAEKAEQLVLLALEQMQQLAGCAHASAGNSAELGAKTTAFGGAFRDLAGAIDSLCEDLRSCEVAFEMFAEPVEAIRSAAVPETHSTQAEIRAGQEPLETARLQPSGNGSNAHDLITLPGE